MTVFTDKRSDKRVACKIPIPVHISMFNSKDSIEGLLVDYCKDGMSFVSKDAILLSTVIVSRIEYRFLNDSGNTDIERLPSMRLGEVKWCRKLSDDRSGCFGVGVKYYSCAWCN